MRLRRIAAASRRWRVTDILVGAMLAGGLLLQVAALDAAFDVAEAPPCAHVANEDPHEQWLARANNLPLCSTEKG